MLVAGYVQLHVRIGVPGRYPGFYFDFCHAFLFVILLFLKKIASDNKVAWNVGFYVSLEMATSGRVLSRVKKILCI